MLSNWLTTEECRRYAPDIKLSDEELVSAIAQAQAIAESPVGANRKLSLERHTEILQIPLSSKVLLSRRPIVGNPSIQVRSLNQEDGFGRQSLTSQWIQFSPEQYSFDPDYGEILLINIGHERNFRLARNYFWHRRPSHRLPRPQIRVTYNTGFDFGQNNPEVEGLKIALSAIVKLRQSGQFQGLKLMEVKDDSYRVEYAAATDFSGASGRIGGSLLDEWLAIFRKYRPREFVA